MQANYSANGSSTYVMEMQPPPPAHTPSKAPSVQDKDLSSPQNDIPGSLPAPTTAVPVLQKWNHPRSNLLRVLATFYSFIILGANDAAYGALIPYLETYYGIDYTTVSLVFLSPVIGYVASALSNNWFHMKFGQRGVGFIMACSHLFAYLIICLHVPYPALVVVFIVAGFGNGLGDSAWNAWIGDMANANEVLGFLHGAYGLGAALSPLVATTVVTKAGWMWYEFYYIMVGAAAIEVVILTAAFWKADGEHFRAEHPQTVESESVPDSPTQTLVMPEGEANAPPTTETRPSIFRRLGPSGAPNAPQKQKTRSKVSSPTKSRTLLAIKNRVTLLTAGFLLVYVGIEVSIGGWIVTFMLRVRHGSPFASGLTSTGFWLGITVGRLILGFVTARVFRSEKHAVATYIVLSVALQLLFWLVPQFEVSAVMIGLLGFFLGPLFPAAVVVLTKLLPKHLHVASVGFAAAFGASGATILPFAVGAIANARGVQVLQPIVLAFLVVALGIWWCIPKLPKVRTA